MTSNGRRIGALVVASLLAVAGCTGTDVLTSGSGELELHTQVTNVSGRFVDNSLMDRAQFEIRQLEVRPQSADAEASLGPTNLGLLRTPLNANFISGVSRVPITPQTSGSYRFVRMVVPTITMRDVDDLTVAGLSDPVSPVCHDFIKNAELNFTGQSTLFAITAADLGAPVTVSLDADHPGQLNLQLDYPAFLSALNASLNCSSCACPGRYMPNVIPRNCTISGAVCSVDADCGAGRTCEDCTCPITTNNFNRTTFKSLASTFVSFD